MLRGGGDRAFVSGGDLKELTAVRTYEDAVRMASRVRQLLDRVAAFPVPVVAALNGHALGGGAEVAIAADIRIAADDVKIGFNQVTLGIMPAWGGAERLAQAIGRSRALLAIATGELYDAPTAQRLGLVDVVVPRAAFEDGVAGARAPDGRRGPGHDARGEVRGRAPRRPRTTPSSRPAPPTRSRSSGRPTRTGQPSRRSRESGERVERRRTSFLLVAVADTVDTSEDEF